MSGLEDVAELALEGGGHAAKKSRKPLHGAPYGQNGPQSPTGPNDGRAQMTQNDYYDPQQYRNDHYFNGYTQNPGTHPGRPGMPRRASSLDRGTFYDRRHRRPRRDRAYYSSDSESSSSSDSSRGRGNRRSRSRRSRSRPEQTASDEDIPSEGEEKRKRKAMGKQLLAGAFATIATVHAGNKIHGSYQASIKRRKDVKSGKMTEEEASVAKNKARIQDATAVVVAAFGIKGAMAQWKGVKEHHEGYKEHKHLVEKRRDKIKHKPNRSRSKSKSRDDRFD